MPNPKKTDNKKEDTQEARLPLSDPPPWFHEEMEKGFLRIQELIDGRLSKFAESLEKMGNKSKNGGCGNKADGDGRREWLPKILGQEDEIYKTERAHRTLQRQPAENGKPRAILIRLLQYRDTLKILNAAREKGKLPMATLLS
ncbi:hypothetical protein QQF64_001976 [Cirrhinus molitorella]|uniref:Uncharacterized protein n=1 Tax=Cirrhinus molitorella TaxID=172907 RepID=A0ABR3MNV9_9TELE